MLNPQKKHDGALPSSIFENLENSNQVDISISREWFTTEQAAEYLGVSPATLRNLTSNDKVPFYKFGRRNRYRLPELRELLIAGKRGSSYGN
jgi:excisionase family DNA binding protein